MIRKSPCCHLAPFDCEPDLTPRRGDYLMSIGKRGPGSAYFVLQARQVKSRRAPAGRIRWSLQCQRVGLESIPLGVEVLTFYWYPRKRKDGGKCQPTTNSATTTR